MKIGELLNMKSNTVGDIVRRFRNVGRVASIKQKGRPKKLTTREGILRKVKTKLNSSPNMKNRYGHKLFAEQ